MNEYNEKAIQSIIDVWGGEECPHTKTRAWCTSIPLLRKLIEDSFVDKGFEKSEGVLLPIMFPRDDGYDAITVKYVRFEVE